MRNPRLAAQSRDNLEARLRGMRPVRRFQPPVRGWIKAIREALGMSTAQLARRLKIKQPSVVAIEASERKGTIEMATLRRVAEALNCTLVYALVPNEPLDKIVHDRAQAVARRRMQSVGHSMALEDQAVPASRLRKQQHALARGLHSRALWDEP